MNRITSENLFNSIRSYIEEAKRHVVQNINSAMVYTYYHIGKIIVEEEQNGMDRAGYGRNPRHCLGFLKIPFSSVGLIMCNSQDLI